MALLVCNDCGCEFAIGVRMCPQCTSENAHEKGDEMAPKSTVHGGPSNADEEAAEWDGSKPSTSSEKEPTTGESSSPSDPLPAPTTENPSSPDLTESSSAGTTDGAGTAADPYDTWRKEDLGDELADRGLPVSGNKPELIARLREDDAAKAQQNN